MGCIHYLELYYVQPSCCRNFSAAKILQNPNLKNKRKFFIGGFEQAIRLRFTGVSSR